MSQLTLTPCHSPMTMASPLANSTRIQTCVSNNNTNIIINNYNYNQIVITEGEAAGATDTTHKPRKLNAAGGKKPLLVARKPLASKKITSNSIVKSANNTKKVPSVERILSQINMSKYTNLFKNCDLNKFKELRELDLNAMGITRPQELRTFKEAINKAKAEHINSII